MSTPLEELAVETVNAMRFMGATFIVEGPPSDLVFVWEVRERRMRDAVRAYWNGVDKPPGLRKAMTRVIVRQQAAGGRAL